MARLGHERLLRTGMERMVLDWLLRMGEYWNGLERIVWDLIGCRGLEWLVQYRSERDGILLLRKCCYGTECTGAYWSVTECNRLDCNETERFGMADKAKINITNERRTTWRSSKRKKRR